MPSNASKLLDKARRSSSGWRRTEIDALFTRFGFVIENRTRHDIAYHPDYLELKLMLPRHRMVNHVYVEKAVKLIDRLLELQAEKGEENNE
jgi:hypothetical protein